MSIIRNKQVDVNSNFDFKNHRLINLSYPLNNNDAANKLYVDENTIISGGTINGDLILNGDLYVSGITTTIDVNNVNIRDNIILLNSGETTNNVSLIYSGIEIDRGSSTNYRIVFNDDTDTFQVGFINNLQTVAIREDSPNSSGVSYWNNTLKRFDTSNKFIYNENYLYLNGKFYVSGLTSGSTANMIYYNTSTNEFLYGTLPISSQWVNNGSNIYYNNGNVSIGNSATTYRMMVGSTIGNEAIGIYSSPTGYASLYFGDTYTSTGSYEGMIEYSNNNNTMYFGTEHEYKLALNNSGNLGVGFTGGTELSNYKLSVNGNIFSNSSLITNTSVYSPIIESTNYLKTTKNEQGAGVTLSLDTYEVNYGTYVNTLYMSAQMDDGNYVNEFYINCIVEDGGNLVEISSNNSPISINASYGLYLNAPVNGIQVNNLLRLNNSTTSSSSFNIPHGTAPSSPNNGDIWTTTSGLYARISGSTVGPFISGYYLPLSGGTLTGTVTGTQLNLSGQLYLSGLTLDNPGNLLCYNSLNKKVTYADANNISVGFSTNSNFTLNMRDIDTEEYLVYVTSQTQSELWFENDDDYQICVDYSSYSYNTSRLNGYSASFYNTPFSKLTSGSSVSVSCLDVNNFVLTTASSAFTISLSNYLNGHNGIIIINLSASSTDITILNTPTAYKNGTYTGLTSGTYILQYWIANWDSSFKAYYKIEKYT